MGGGFGFDAAVSVRKAERCLKHAGCVMSAIISTLSQPIELSSPRVPISIRLATMEDLPFIDALQKIHTKQVGFMPQAQLRGKIEAGHVLVAEAAAGGRDQDAGVRNASELSL